MDIKTWREEKEDYLIKAKKSANAAQLENILAQYLTLKEEMPQELPETERTEYSRELIRLQKTTWLRKVIEQFERTYPNHTKNDITRLNTLLTRLLVNTHKYLVKVNQEKLSSTLVMSSPIYVSLMLQLTSLVLTTTGPTIPLLITFFLASSGYLVGHRLGNRKAPTMETILSSPHLDSASLGSIMTIACEPKDFLADLEKRIQFSEQALQYLSSNWRLLYNASVCGMHSALAEYMRETLSDGLQLIGSMANFSSRCLSSTLGWIGLKSVVTATTSLLDNCIAASGLKTLATEVGRLTFMFSSQLPAPSPQDFAPSTLNSSN